MQQINADGLTKGPAAVADPFASVFGSQQQVAYLDRTGTIWDSWYDGHWNLQQINGAGGLTKGPAAVGGPFIWTVPDSTRQQHFTYRDQKGTIWDSWYDGHWNLQQINVGGVTKGPAAIADPFASVFGRQQHVAYLDATGTIWDSWYDGHWNLQQINGAGGHTKGPAAAGGPFVWTAGSQQHFTYRDQRGTIWDSWFDGRWNLQQINGAGGLTGGPPTVGEPCATSFGSQQHVFYRDGTGTIWDSWYDGHGWSLQHLNAGGVTKAPAAGGDPFVSLFLKLQMHVSYRDGAGTIWDSWYDGATSHWNLQRINAGGLTKGPAASGGPFVWTVAFGTVAGGEQQQHFTYRDTTGTIWDSWYNDNAPTRTDGGAAPSAQSGLSLYSVTLYDAAGNQIQAPTAGLAFQMCINVQNRGTVAISPSPLSVQESGTNGYTNSFSQAVPQLAVNAGYTTKPCFQVLGLNSGVTYDFNIYDPPGNFLSDQTYSE